MAVTVNGSATFVNVAGITVGSGTPTSNSYNCPAGTTAVLFIPLVNCAAPAVETALTYNGVAASLIASSFISNNAGDQTSLWGLNAPSTGSNILAVTWAQAVGGGGGVIAIPFTGTDSSAPFSSSAANNFSNALVTSGSITLPGATAIDLAVAGILVDGGAGLPTAVDGQTSLINTTSRGSVTLLGSSAAGGSTSMTWNTFSIANAYTAAGIAVKAPAGAPSIPLLGQILM
jgi:hypothetical protein